MIKTSFNCYLETLSQTKGIVIEYFNEYKSVIFQLVNERISHLKDTINTHNIESVFDDHLVKSELKSLQKNFVLVPVDKACNNIAFVCKRVGTTLIDTLSMAQTRE